MADDGGRIDGDANWHRGMYYILDGKKGVRWLYKLAKLAL